jgi:hypothetical protein
MCSGFADATMIAIRSPVIGSDSMPRIRITTDAIGTPDVAVILDERIATTDLDSDHFGAALVERIGWALSDADEAERRKKA